MTEHYDALIVGAGPAGLAATHTAASHGMRVALIDAGLAQRCTPWLATPRATLHGSRTESSERDMARTHACRCCRAR